MNFLGAIMTYVPLRLAGCCLFLSLAACGAGSTDTSPTAPDQGEIDVTEGGNGEGTDGGDETAGGDETGNEEGTEGADGTGGGDGGGEDPGPVSSRLNIVTVDERIIYEEAFLTDFVLLRDTVKLGGLAPFDALPTTGSASFDGYMQVIIGNASVSANVIGNTTLSVDLAGGPITGSASGFLGTTLDDALVTQVVSYEGVIAITGGGVSERLTGGSAINFDINGSLDSGLNTFGIAGTLNGFLYGPEGSGLFATGSHGGLSNDIEATIDGSGSVPIGIASVWATKE